MKHKVTCMDCGKTERIIVFRGKRIKSGWAYYGKINVNACQTRKYFLRPRDQTKIFENLEKVPNSCYDPNVKPKNVEMWSCPQCHGKIRKESSSVEQKEPAKP